MRYSDDYLRNFLPEEDPPDGTVSREVLDEVGSWLDRSYSIKELEPRDYQLVARATRWTYAVFSELGLGRYRLERYFPSQWGDPFRCDGKALAGGHQTVSFGLYDQEAGESGLGIIVDVPLWPGQPLLVVDYVSFPRLGNMRFPVALRQSELELHIAHPQGGTATCWAQCNSSGQWGFLTAGHVVSGNHPGWPVPLAGGGSGALLRSHYQPVDAAFVNGLSPANTSPVSVLSFPGVGMAVDVLCQSGTQSRTVVQVTNNMGVLHTRSIGIYVYLDQPASPGDSGALVRTTTGDAVGIYSGQMTAPGHPNGLCGYAQNFEQAIFALDVTAYL